MGRRFTVKGHFGVMPCESDRKVSVCVLMLWPYHNVKYRLLRGIYFQDWKQEETSVHRDIVSSCLGPFSYLIA